MAVTGRIHKGIGGFYYVETADGLYECKARGAFRKQRITPLVGDRVEITVNAQGENTIDTILPRKNELRRPPLANLDRLFIVSSLVDPEIRTVQIDKLTVLAAQKGIDCVIVLTKADLAENGQQYADIYKTAGYPVVLCNARTGEGADQLPGLISGKLCAFTGNSGVGKSTLLNRLCPDLALETGETSKKLGRGRHTTRHCELYPVAGGWVADTPPDFLHWNWSGTRRSTRTNCPVAFRIFALIWGIAALIAAPMWQIRAVPCAPPWSGARSAKVVTTVMLNFIIR